MTIIKLVASSPHGWCGLRCRFLHDLLPEDVHVRCSERTFVRPRWHLGVLLSRYICEACMP